LIVVSRTFKPLLTLENILNFMISYEKSTPFTTLTPLQTKKGCGKKDIDSLQVNSVHVKDFKRYITTNGPEPPR